MIAFKKVSGVDTHKVVRYEYLKMSLRCDEKAENLGIWRRNLMIFGKGLFSSMECGDFYVRVYSITQTDFYVYHELFNETGSCVYNIQLTFLYIHASWHTHIQTRPCPDTLIHTSLTTNLTFLNTCKIRQFQVKITPLLSHSVNI